MSSSQHWYTKRGASVTAQTPKAMPSVTTILSVRDKPELNEWRLRVGAEAAFKRMTEASERGTAIHLLVSDWIEGKAVEPEKPEYEERLNGFINWQDKKQPTDLESEIFVYSRQYGYAGTADIVCRIQGELWLIDIKTSRTIDPSYGLQLRAYEQALFESRKEHARMGVLQLTAENKSGYRFKETDEPLDVFLACKTVFDWNRKYDKAPKFDGRFITR